MTASPEFCAHVSKMDLFRDETRWTAQAPGIHLASAGIKWMHNLSSPLDGGSCPSPRHTEGWALGIREHL